MERFFTLYKMFMGKMNKFGEYDTLGDAHHAVGVYRMKEWKIVSPDGKEWHSKDVIPRGVVPPRKPIR